MDLAARKDPTRSPVNGPDQPRVAKPWVKNLLAAQGFDLPEGKQFWWNVHLEAFLRCARKRGPEIPLEQIVADHLTALRAEQPPISPWRLEQVRLALEVFERGIEHWRWETNAQGRLMPRFRIKCSVGSAPAVAAAELRRAQDQRGEQPQRTRPLTGKPERRPTDFQHDPVNSGNRPLLAAKSSAVPDGNGSGAAPKDAGEAIDRLRREIRLAHYSWRTEQSYTEAVASFLRYFPAAVPAEMTDAHVKSYLEHLAVERSVSASTQNQAFSAILFLFRRVLGREMGELGETLRARRPQRLPVV